MKTTNSENAKVFKAFCDEKRLLIIELLRSGEKCVCVLIEKTGMGQSTLSYHMKILCEAGVVEGRQEGKWTHYSLSVAGRNRAICLLTEITATDAPQISV